VVDERIHDWVGQLGDGFETVWASSWYEDLLWSGVSEPLGLPRWPSVNAIAFNGTGRVGAKAKR